MKRTPVRGPARKPVQKAAKTKVRVDPVKEFREAIGKVKYVDILPLSDDSVLSHVKGYVSTQSLSLDRALGGPGRGFPRGRVTEVFGPEGIGKSALMDHGFAETQKMGGHAILIDTEETRDMAFSRQIGVDVDKLEVIQFKRNEQTVEHVYEVMARTIDFWAEKHPDEIVMIGWDSVAATSTQDELDGDIGESHGARPAQMLKRGMRRIVPKLAGTNIAVILSNHQYVEVGGFGHGPKKKKVYGGGGIAYLATLRLEMFRLEMLKSGSGEVVGNKIGIRVWKNKTSKNWNTVAELGVMNGVGVDNVWTIYDVFHRLGYITTGGGWNQMQLEGEPLMRWQNQWLGLGELCAKTEGLWDKLVRIYNALEF